MALVPTALPHKPAPPSCSCLQPGDSDTKKFEGAFLNALVYVLIVTAMTFVLVLLFKFGVRACSVRGYGRACQV